MGFNEIYPLVICYFCILLYYIYIERIHRWGKQEYPVLHKNPSYRKPINANQEYLLKLTFKFRFVTTELIAHKLGRHPSTIYERFHTLENQGFIHKIYKGSYRLLGRPAVYCLAPAGIKYLPAAYRPLP